MFFKLAWRNIWRNKRRSIITISSIGLAVFFASFMRSLQEGAYGRMVDNSIAFFTGYVQVQHKDFQENRSLDESILYNDSLKMLSSLENVAAIIPRLEYFALSASVSKSKGTAVLGINPEGEQMLSKLKDKLIAGSYLSNEDDAVIVAEGLANYLDLGISDTLVLIGQGYQSTNAAGKYVIKGIVKLQLPQLNQGVVYLPLRLAQNLFAAENRISSLIIQPKDPSKLDALVGLLRQNCFNPNLKVLDWKAMLPELLQQIELDRTAGVIILYILYMVIGFGIFGTILMLLAERRHEFGVVISIGMKRGHLLAISLLEILTMAVVGVISGVLLASPLIAYFYKHPIRFWGEMAKAYEKFGIEPIIPTAFLPNIFIQQAIVVLIITTLVSIYPLYQSYRLKPLEAMRS